MESSKYIKKFFNPEKDITVYELARILAHTSIMGRNGINFSEDQWKYELIGSDSLSRHFKDHKL
jgi:hypothetical protein